MNEFIKLNKLFARDILNFKWDSIKQLSEYLAEHAYKSCSIGYCLDAENMTLDVVIIADNQLKGFNYEVKLDEIDKNLYKLVLKNIREF